MSEYVSSYRPGYPGGKSQAVLRREAARKAGFASGVARRRASTCRRQPRARTGQEALALRYSIRQVGRDEFERLYRAMCEREEIPFDPRGLRSTLELYRQQMTAYRAQGQDWETTNAQMARGMELRGRARCRRTVQRLRKRLVLMGLIAYAHVRRSGRLRIPGKMDTLRVRCLCAKANVTPPPGAGASPFGTHSLLLSRQRQKTLSPPPSAADDVGRRSASPGIEDGEDEPAAESVYASEEERRLAYLELCEAHAPTFLGPTQLRELRLLRSRFGASGQDTALTASIAAEGER